MIVEPITKAEQKYIINKLNLGVFLVLLFFIVPLVFGVKVEFNHLNNFLLFVIFKYVCIGVWLYLVLKLLMRAVVFYHYLFHGEVKKITAEFIVTKREILRVSNDDGSD